MKRSLFLIATIGLISGCCSPFAFRQTAVEKFTRGEYDPALEKQWPDATWQASEWKNVSFSAYEPQPDDIDKFTNAGTWQRTVAGNQGLLVSCDVAGNWKIVGRLTNSGEMRTTNYWRIQFGRVEAADKSTFVPYATQNSVPVGLDSSHPEAVTAGSGDDAEIRRNYGKINAARTSLESEQHCDDGALWLFVPIIAAFYLLNPFNWFR